MIVRVRLLRSLVALGILLGMPRVAVAQEARPSGVSPLFFPLGTGDRWEYVEFDGVGHVDTVDQTITGDTVICGVSYKVMLGQYKSLDSVIIIGVSQKLTGYSSSQLPSFLRFDSVGNLVQFVGPETEVLLYRLGDISNSPWLRLGLYVARFDSVEMETIFDVPRRVLGVQYFASDTNFVEASAHQWLVEGIGLERTVWTGGGGGAVLAGARIDGVGYGSLTDVPRASASPLYDVSLSQNYPNPFNPSTNIRFELPKTSHVNLTVFDVLGRQVSVLVNARREAGVHQVKFDGSGLASGVYLYRLTAGNFVETRKLLLLR